MGRLLVALHPDAVVDAAGFTTAWNGDRRARGAGTAEAKPADPGQFIPGMGLVVVQLKGNPAPRAIYKVLKGVLKTLRQDSVKPTAALLSVTPGGDGDLFAVIPTASRVLGNGPRTAVFTAALTSVCWLSRTFSPARWFDWDFTEWKIQTYVLFWLAGLSAILAFGPTTGWPRFVMLAIVLYRLQELMFATLDNAFQLTERARRRPNPAYKWPTPLLLALVSIVQVVLIFAIAYFILIGQNRAAVTPPPSNPFDSFFLSWISLPPLGGGATPLSTMARALTITEEATALMLVVIAIGRFLAGAGPDQG
jgi:hypothetical protein